MDQARGRGGGDVPAPETEEGALDALERDHQELGALFEQLLARSERGEDAAQRARDLLELGCLLLSHTRAEEEVFFARMYRNPELRPTADRCLDEHTEIEVLLEHLTGLDADDEAWGELLWTLASSFELHALQEEREVYPQAIAELGVAELGALMSRYQSCRARWVRCIGGELSEAQPGRSLW